jgi:hypothetical protein
MKFVNRNQQQIIQGNIVETRWYEVLYFECHALGTLGTHCLYCDFPGLGAARDRYRFARALWPGMHTARAVELNCRGTKNAKRLQIPA